MSAELQLLIAIGSPIFAAGGAYAAVRVHLHYLRRDIDEARGRIDELVRTLMQERSLRTGRFERLLMSHAPTRPR